MALCFAAMAGCAAHPTPGTPAGSQPVRQGQDAAPGAPGQPSGRWSREAAAADQAAVEDTSDLLRQAREALGDPRGTERATELLERAESRLLTRSTARGDEERPMNEGPQRHIAQTRRALAGGNRQEAIRLIQDALQRLQDESRR
ncbi:MAG TPA: hypothetical protein VD970_00450 [Acetobacteraceae bacterium]|nr:hypothetical protein [Acetobacteraceae bacterium]